MSLAILAGTLITQGIISIGKALLDKTSEKAADFIKEKTGVDLNLKTINKEDLTDEEIEILRNFDLEFQKEFTKRFGIEVKDRHDARNMNYQLQASKSWLVRSTGSMIALLTLVGAFILDVYIVYTGFTKGIMELNPVITLIAGNVSARAGQVLSFYFGTSKREADRDRMKRI